MFEVPNVLSLKLIFKKQLLIHENKRQLKCSHDGCDKIFNTKSNLNHHRLVNLKNKLFKYNYCSH